MTTMKDRGVTLVELMVVIAIIAVLMVALGFNYVGWMGAYKIEKETKDVYADLLSARSMAITRGQNYFMDFPTATTYRLIEDRNNNAVSDPGPDVTDDAILPTYPKTVEHAITWNTGGTMVIDKRGIMTPGTICFAALNAQTEPDYDCVVIAETRVNMGKLATQIFSGGLCNATNCAAK